MIVAEDDQWVSVLVLVEPPSGDQTCPSNPSFEHEVELGSALGDRTVLDASVDPPLERPWPPTESSIESLGLAEWHRVVDRMLTPA